MEKRHYIDVITLEEFDALLDKYSGHVPTKLAKLEEERLHEIPEALSGRKDAFLQKSEVQSLVEWKLAHGTFRPSLRKLVASNSDEAVATCTRTAFEMYSQDGGKWDAAVSSLAKDLRGVGPATASLLLNTYDSERVPFFSDELFRWVMYEEGKGNGWGRKLKYSMAEYRELFERVGKLRERLVEGRDRKITSTDAEMVAYVLGQGGIDTGKGKRKAGEGGEEDAPSQRRVTRSRR